ncbi:ribonuclease H2 non-catalytic subunit-domain-containing protein [Pseudomassariella vexata]|uniref:Ribonuclease H2 non-catalytic subunit-domain-containing protein n=1 Tax=Pseudomassariella vexata TaxID=1141098 RepID=A0A1Y2DKG0_9PEZI|nr:ribonuclease H2 non-catalytic subunit-domain-containing protein [Pseudomassariella vexata]ORY59723.1 ribonuclease H2 non-catalytic subunit-domain-containing protein [Pseudomassariella vexata]
MSQPILTVSGDPANPNKSQLHLLPCRIHHDGHVDPVDPYWSPSESKGGMKIAYLRGRKLHGKEMKLPKGYYGSVVEKGPTKAEIPKEEMDEEADVQELPEAVETALMKGKAQFDNVVVWGHESLAESSADPFVRGIEEWVSFAEQIHSYPSQDVGPTKGRTGAC